MYYIDIQAELRNLSAVLKQQDVSKQACWRIQQQGSLQHWQDILTQLECHIEDDSIWFNRHEDADLDVYMLMEQEIIFKQLCLELSALLRLSYDLGLNRAVRLDLYAHILNLWLGYADLLSTIQQQGEMKATSALILEVDYATALLLISSDVILNEGDEIVKIVDSLLADHTDRLLDVLIQPYLQQDKISEHYALSYPFEKLNQCVNSEANIADLKHYMMQIEADQAIGYFWEKKRFHHLQVLGQWRFEVLALAIIYQLDVSSLKAFATFPADD